MSTSTPPSTPSSPNPPPTGQGAAPPPHDSGSEWASGGTIFAGVLMLVYGVIAVFQGIAGIAKDDVYAAIGDYVFEFNTTAWGWIHLILGVITAIAGWGVFKGATWARVVGVALASLVVIANFMWLPYQPVWAVVAIALGVFVIWSLCTDKSQPLI
ncbi:hypothetical protein AB0M28_30385 [Streptomyces sp. NPDC051940]|uniref:DUF7144 family membrane protein n=1 Tax=Streptomyces sp. NPDC051940 TaxID=3155675 RepID=UPI0034419A01